MSGTNVEALKLPMAPVIKIMKKAAGDGINFSNEFKTATARSSAVFMLNTVDVALEIATKEKRSTITAGDIVAAVSQLDHPEFQDALRETLEAYRAQKPAKSAKKSKK